MPRYFTRPTQSIRHYVANAPRQLQKAAPEKTHVTVRDAAAVASASGPTIAVRRETGHD